jgi:hypothetical protein
MNLSVTNFRNAFMLAGVDFYADMTNFLFGDVPRTPKEAALAQDETEMILNAWANTDWGFSAEQIDASLDAATFASYAQAQLNMIGMATMGSRWSPVNLVATPTDVENPQRVIAIAMLAALSVPGVKVEHVIATPGLLTVERGQGSQISLLNDTFMSALMNPDTPETRKLLLGRINGRFPKDPNTGRPLYFFDNSFNFHVRIEGVKDGDYREEVGTLQMVLPIPAAENAVVNSYNALAERQSVSPHIANVINAAFNGRVATEPAEDGKPTQVEQLFGENTIMRFDQPEDCLLYTSPSPRD